MRKQWRKLVGWNSLCDWGHCSPNVSEINHFVKKAIEDKKLHVYWVGGPLKNHKFN